MGGQGRWLLAGLVLVSAALWGFGMTEQRFNGASAGDYFEDAQLAALARAGCTGNSGAVRRLVGEGVDVNGAGAGLMTPLGWTVRCGNLKGVEALLDAGADPNQKDEFGLTPFMTAIEEQDDQNILGLLIDRGANLYDIGDGGRPAIAFSQGYHYGRWGNYYLMLDRGIDINHVYLRDLPNMRGETIAIYMATLGSFDKVIELIDRGFNRELGELAVVMHIHNTDPNIPAWEHKQQLIGILEARGVPYEQLAAAFDAGDRTLHLEQY